MRELEVSEGAVPVGTGTVWLDGGPVGMLPLGAVPVGTGRVSFDGAVVRGGYGTGPIPVAVPELLVSVPDLESRLLVQLNERELVGAGSVSLVGGDVSSGGYGAGPVPEIVLPVPVGMGKEEFGGGIPTLGPVESGGRYCVGTDGVEPVAGKGVELDSVPGDLGPLGLVKENVRVEEDGVASPEASVLVPPVVESPPGVLLSPELVKVPVDVDGVIWPEAAVPVNPEVSPPETAPDAAVPNDPPVLPVDKITVVPVDVLVIGAVPTPEVPLTGAVEPAPPLPSPPSSPPRAPELRMTVWMLNAEVEVTVVIGAVSPPAPPPDAPSSPPRPPELRITVCVLIMDVELKTGGGVWMAPEAKMPDPPPVKPELRMIVCVEKDDTEDVMIPAPLFPMLPDAPPSTAWV